jgi:exo-beta-1,3-glucanase (GH17 family)
VCATVLIASLWLWQELIGPLLWPRVVAPQAHTLVYSHRWVTYDPRPSELKGYPFFLMKQAGVELGWIRQAGFDGIITFSSQKDFAKIPQSAHEQGLSVIAGIWNPKDKVEIASAFAVRQYVDGYCVGHDGLHFREISGYTMEDLERTIARLRFRTSKPVTTTEVIESYLSETEGSRLLRMGDWVFPDVHVSIRSDGAADSVADVVDAIRDGKETVKMAKKIAREDRDGRPILLKMVTYPMKGVTNASLEEQAAFFVQILENRRDVLADMPNVVCVSVHSAFDMSWKTGWPYFEWDLTLVCWILMALRGLRLKWRSKDCHE